MKRKWFSWAVAAFWLGMMAWLVRYEAYPAFFARRLAGYRDLYKDGPLISDHWMKILVQGQHIGYTHSLLQLDEMDPAGRYQLHHQTVLNLMLMGRLQLVTLNATAVLDVFYILQRFTFNLHAGHYSVRLQGLRSAKDLFTVQLQSAAGQQTLRARLPEDAVLYSPMTETALKKLRPGREVRILTLDPVTLTAADMMVRAVRRELLIWQGREQMTTRLVFSLGAAEVRAWMDDEGRLLRQETPMGWVMEAATAEEAMAVATRAGEAPDMLRAASVPLVGEIRNPAAVRAWEVALRGNGLAGLQLATHRQQIVSSKEQEIVLAVAAETPPAGAAAPSPPELDAWRAATLFIQSDHPDLRERARAIAGGKTTPWEQACALHEWVYRNVKKNPTVSLPSALDVLRNLEGDCNEHTYLFVALARAIGLPARIRVGLVLVRGALYFHAWPEVYAGRWVEMDPTLGQVTVDATHLALLEGEIVEQMKILPLLGRTTAAVRSVTYREAAHD